MISCIAPQTPEQFTQYYQLRWQVLRAPWYQPFGSEKDELENCAVHRMLIDDTGNILAIGRLHIDSEWVGHIRYIATAPAMQGKGYGQRIMHELEVLAKSRGVLTIRLNARENALSFYQHLNYRKTGIAHRLYDEIQHYAMVKTLPDIVNNHNEEISSLQDIWHRTIPLSKAMGMQTDFYDGDQFITHCDFAMNKNLHDTMFAGSIYTLATLSGWGWVYLTLLSETIKGDIVLAEGKIEYLRPIAQSANAIVQRKNTHGDLMSFSRDGKASFHIDVEVLSGDKVAAKFSGKYVVKVKK
ncbi:bifunctional GNAT family N-acetyltransferase/hotdog fold thioesterase [Thalassotalea sediminis]|uniref:bifunctional GNAT family N-acetyltransferase/hotdog fold thioesterase n=1 Tax=Thalassotalea sediminis TaxID=1759089 RepID=UPI00257280AD|nr:bifunctional GNAT family N-acetyltransferase/hotdog fold thioesterase [Thalassotalea sediminis]